MKRNGFISLIVIIALAVAVYYFIDTNYSKLPNEKSQEVTAKFNTYPTARSWSVSNDSAICLTYFNQCKEVPSVIYFSTNDNWATIYKFYRDNLPKEGWSSNARVVTSFPDVILFRHDNYFYDAVCEAIIKDKGHKNLGLFDSEKTGTYTISISCFQN